MFASIALSILSLLAVPALAGPVAGTTYTISPASHPDYCLAPSGGNEGTGLVIKKCDHASDIVFTYDGAAIKNTETSMCFDIRDGAQWSGNLAQFWQCYSWNGNQQFNLLDSGNIEWAGTNLCLDLKDGVGADNNPVQIWSCYAWNDNQKWIWTEATEVGDDCDDGSGSPTTSPTASPTSAPSPSATDDEDCDDDSSASASASVSQSSIGGGLYAGGGGNLHHSSKTSAASASATSTEAWGSSSADDSWGSSTSSAWGASASASVTASVSASASVSSTSAKPTSGGSGGSGHSGSSDTSGYLKAKGWKVVDPSGNEVVLRGPNIGGWLVNEDWMNGITDYQNPDRFAQNTLESRFGEDQTRVLFNAWYDNYFTTADWDNISAMGFNVVRIPFGWRNLQHADGSWITDSSGNIDFSRLDWAVAQAKQRNIYIIFVFHIWDSQQQSYSMISENTNDGQSSRDRAGEIWKKVGAHFLGESIIAGYDAINEPTGSGGDVLQRDLYTAIRSVDSERLIIMESINTNPSNYGWTNVMYSMHEYLMMTDDYQTNINNYYGPGMYGGGGTNDLIQQWKSWGVPIYAGEFMAMSNTLPWLVDQLNKEGVWWSWWSYSTINMGGWGTYNFPSSNYVNVQSDSFDSIRNTWSNLGRPNRNDNIYSVYTQRANAKRDLAGVERSTMTERAIVKVPRAHRRSRAHTAGVARASAF